MISCQTKFNPADSEWEAWLSAIDDLHRRMGSLSLLVVSDGGHPTKSQLDRLRAVKRTDPPTAIVSPSRALRFFGAALTFINPTIRCFSPDEMSTAYTHIGLGTNFISHANSVVKRLQKQLAVRASA